MLRLLNLDHFFVLSSFGFKVVLLLGQPDSAAPFLRCQQHLGLQVSQGSSHRTKFLLFLGLNHNAKMILGYAFLQHSMLTEASRKKLFTYEVLLD